MPEDIDKILPFDNDFMNQDTITNIDSRLEKIVKNISKPKIVDFALENGISITILGEKLEYSNFENSIVIPLEEIENNNDIFSLLEDHLKIRKGLWQKIRDFC